MSRRSRRGPIAAAGGASPVAVTGSAINTAGGTVTLTIPATAAVGDLIVAAVIDGGAASSTPAGWAVASARALLGFGFGITFYSKTLVGGDPGSTVDFGANGLTVAAYTVNGSAVDASGATTTGGGNCVGPVVTTTKPGDAVLLFMAWIGNPPNTSPNPAGTTNLINANNAGNFQDLVGCVDSYPSAGNTTARTFVSTGAPSGGGRCTAIAIKK
jgi:hypothetical protein